MPETVNRKFGVLRVLLHPTVLVALTMAWSYTVFPHLLEWGVLGTIELLKETPSPWWSLAILALSEVWICLCSANFVAELFQLRLSASELQRIFADQLDQNAPLQLMVILLGKHSYTCTELCILLHNLIFYSFCRAGNCYLIQKSRINTSVGLYYVHGLILASVLIHLVLTLSAFGFLGWSLLMIMHYEAIYILKDAVFTCFLKWHQRQVSVDSETKISLAENLCKVLQWTHIALMFSDITPTNPGNIFLFLKIENHFVTLSHTFRKYRRYLKTLQQFLKKYPRLRPSEVALYGTSVCCVCWDSLEGECCLLNCKHCFHLGCICRWMSTKREKVCPLCHQVYLSEEEDLRHIASYLANRPSNT